MAAEQGGVDVEALTKDNNVKVPLLFGRFHVEPPMLLKYLLGAYIVYFAIFRIVDLMYWATCDCRFPAGLGHFYPSEQERIDAINFTGRGLKITFAEQFCHFLLVLALVLTFALVKFNNAFKGESKRQFEGDGCLRWMWEYGDAGYPKKTLQDFLVGFFTWALSPLKDVTCARCCCGFSPRWGELLRGAILLTLVASLFTLVHMPFKIMRFDLNIEYGFVNTLTISADAYRNQLWKSFWKDLFEGWIPMFVLLLILSCRWGWLLLWSGLTVVVLIAQFHMDIVAPMIFHDPQVFPSADFGVGRGFPFVPWYHSWDWVSMNRIYFPVKPEEVQPWLYSQGSYITRDRSKGKIALEPESAWSGGHQHWVLRQQGNPDTSRTFAQSQAVFGQPTLQELDEKAWTIDNQHQPKAAIGLRQGAKLRNELYTFARQRGIDIGQIYMVDGSHSDARANAFVAGAGSKRIIGLYDTLFLGDNTSFNDALEAAPPPSSADGGLSIFYLSEKLQRVDISEQAENPVHIVAPITAMSDIEIMAVLAHELGHAAMHDVEMNMVVQSCITFVTFAALGWMVHSPVVAAAFGFAMPMSFVGLFAFEYVAGPTLTGVIKFFNDAETRRKEYIADEYAASVSESYAKGLQTALAKLTINSNQDPDEPWYYEMLHADHPTFANRYEHLQNVRARLYH